MKWTLVSQIYSCHGVSGISEFISNSDPHMNLSDELQSQARTNVDMFTWGRIVLFLPKRVHH